MIFVKISSLIKAIPKIIVPKAKNLSAFLLGFSFLIFLLFTSALLTGCGSSKHIQTIPVESIHHDTLYINKAKYDSIYIDNSHLVDRGGDTVYIKDKLIEYRYRFLRDTIRIVKCDSIPYEVRITEIKEVRYIPPWCKWLSAIGGIALLLLSITWYLKLKSSMTKSSYP